jgi:nicotinamidase-related amidase
MSTNAPAPIDPSRGALLVMDYQNGIVGMVENSDELLAIARNLTKTFREHGGTVGYVRVGFADGDLDDVPATSGMAAMITPDRREMMHADAPATQIHESIAPEEGDIVVRKQRVGAFSTTDLDDQLKARGIDTLVLAGISTSGVVLSTVRDAHDRDYRLIVLADLCGDRDPEVHAVLIGKVFPSQAEVIDAAELHGLLH